MKNYTKISRFFILFLLFSFLIQSCTQGPKSTQSKKTSFAIVVDPLTMEKVNAPIMAYKSVLESEGLTVYLLSENWDSPQLIKDELQKYYNSEPQLEGAVFIGDVPIPFIMDAQHLATAYKRDQKRYPLHVAAIPSDRFYDDFDLKFEFIEHDSIRKNNYYYSLTANSPQYIKSDIYSGRIKPSIKEGEDKYQLIADYLKKVVSLRNSTELDFLMSFTGHGYNGEALTAWAGEKLALREQFPELFTAQGRVEFLEFRMDEFMKPYLLGRLQDPDLDIALLHEHGTPEMQLINGTPDVSAVPASIENIKRYLRSKLRSSKDYGKTVQEGKKYYMDWLGVSDKWFEGTFDKQVIDQDSIYDYNMDIYAEDAHEISPEAKFIMFDACFNGSFHLDRYLAGEYVFGKGSTMVAHANTVNALQDKWPDEMIGLLKLGVRIGQWAKQINTIETHIIGDPTYYFKTNQEFDYNKLIVACTNKPQIWNAVLEMDDPDLQCLAVSNLYDHENKAFSGQLRDMYFSSPSFVVRMEVLNQLYKYNDENFREVLVNAITDPYELIRRNAATMIGNCGDDELINPLLKIIFDDKYSKRVKYNAYSSFDFMNPDALIHSLPEIAQKYSYVLNNSSLRDDLLKKAAYNKNKVKEAFDFVASDSVEMKYRSREINTLRNYYYHFMIEDYLALLSNPDFDDELSLPLIEALGWFTHSVHRDKILEVCRDIKNNDKYSMDIRTEAERTINRIELYN
jgi:HEAT repeats